MRTTTFLLGNIRKFANALGISLVVARRSVLQKEVRIQSFGCGARNTRWRSGKLFAVASGGALLDAD